MTKEELVKTMGIENESFDYALPQDWLNDIAEKTGMSYSQLLHGFVWMYDKTAGACGRPYPLTLYASHALKRYETVLHRG